MRAASVSAALAAARSWLAEQDAPESVLAGAAGGGPGEGREEDATRWIRRILDQQEPGGSWGGELVATAVALIRIRELREAAGLQELDPGVGRALDWLRARRGVAGAWTDGCDDDRHARGFCHHFAGGFFSPGPPEVPLGDVRLPGGTATGGETEARFIGSALALRALLEWQEPGTDARLHLEALRRLVRTWPKDPPPGLGTVALLAATRALLVSEADADRDAATWGLRVVSGKQRGDGSWVDTDAFQALEVFTVADATGLDSERSRRALWHGARLLTAAQDRDGSWGGGDAAPRRALIACRTLERVDPDSI